MAGTDILSKLKILLPSRTKPKGSIQTPTYDDAQKSSVLSVPTYKDHLSDLISNRQSQDSQTLILDLLRTDPDASSALNSYLTTADVEPYILVKDPDGVIDRDGHKIVNQVLEALSVRRDYSKGFMHKRSLRAIFEDMRYMILARGGVGVEAVFDEVLSLSEIRNVDLASIRWQEKQAGLLTPYQDRGQGDPITIDIPTFFVGFYRKSPTSAYTYSPFISAINTMAARQQVINDLYRIMQVTGYPRITIKVLEEVLAKNAPADVRSDQRQMRQYINARRTEILGQFSSIRPDEPLVHMDSVDISILNDKAPAMSLNITSIIDTLNAQNQAGLRTMATVLGRGEVGVNTATVEAQLFARNAASINKPIGEVISSVLTLAIRLLGSESRVILEFPDIDLRSELELEAQLNLKANRLRSDLSDGLITDDEYHLKMYKRIRPDSAPELMGTKFVGASMKVDPAAVSPNSDPTGRSVSRAADKAAKSNQNKIKQ
jgi:hypothetical protein